MRDNSMDEGLHVHIERLVLEGVPAPDERTLVAAIEAAITGSGAMPQSRPTPGPVDSTSAAIATQVATAVRATTGDMA